MEFTFITFSDVHISDNGPRSRTDNFKETILNKLSQIKTACIKLKADAAIGAGDLFNLKQPAKNSHNLNQELINVFKQFPCPIYMIEGNHDLTANRLESLSSQPLGVLFADRTLTQLRHQIIEKEGHKVSLVGIPYTENLDLNSLSIPDKGDCISQICVLHAYTTLKSGTLFEERLYGYDELSRLPADIFVLGHYHMDQGIYQENGKYFINLGSIARGTNAEEDINHHPKIGFIKITVEDSVAKYTVIPVKLKIRPAAEVFDLEKKEKEKKESKELELFVAKIASEAIKDQGINTNKSIDDIISGMDIMKAVKDRAQQYIQMASTKKKIALKS